MTKQLTSAAILTLALALLNGCATRKGAAYEGNPSMLGGWPTEETTEYKATIQSVDAKERTVVLTRKDGSTASCKFGPDVPNYDQFMAGDKVKAKVEEQSSVFLMKNGPPPSTGEGVWVRPQAEGATGGNTLLKTIDTPVTVESVDPSYRLLKLKYPDGKVKEIKVDLPATLLDVQPGDKAVVRSTQGMVVKIKNKNKSQPSA